MRLRTGFVSNSSSCSYIVEFGRKVDSPEDLKEILDKDFMKRAVRAYNSVGMKELISSVTFEDVCRLIYRLSRINDPSINGRNILEADKDGPEELPTLSEFRKSFLRRKCNKYYKDLLNTPYVDDRFYVEERIWEDYKMLYEEVCTNITRKEIQSHPVEVAYFSFGNESEYFGLSEEDTNKYGLDFTPEERSLVVFIRNLNLAHFLFRGLTYAEKECS